MPLNHDAASQPTTEKISRRTLAIGAAWSVPVITGLVASPAAAASLTSASATSVSRSPSNKTVTVTASFSGTTSLQPSNITMWVATAAGQVHAGTVVGTASSATHVVSFVGTNWPATNGKAPDGTVYVTFAIGGFTTTVHI